MNDDPHGLYADLRDLLLEFGFQNIAAWSNPRGTGEMQVENIQMALDAADAEIIQTFVGVDNYVIPLAPIGMDAARVKRWAVVLAGWWLYSLASIQDVDANYDAMLAVRDDVRNDLARAKTDRYKLNAERRPAPRE